MIIDNSFNISLFIVETVDASEQDLTLIQIIRSYKETSKKHNTSNIFFNLAALENVVFLREYCNSSYK